ncbi:MAG: cytochrome c family protein [Alphaproteobacteria bacterium]|nr:cytochrome c family protein [Alphaproteobacteria bacterium]
MKLVVFAAIFLLTEFGVVRAEGDASKGAEIFKKCAACHSVTEKTNKVGPYLVGIAGRKTAAAEGYNYSEALKTFAQANAVWDDASLDQYLTDPKAMIPGNKMPFAGLKDVQERADLITFLKTKM